MHLQDKHSHTLHKLHIFLCLSNFHFGGPIAPFLQTFTQFPQFMHNIFLYINSFSYICDSGFEHQTHLSGHPFRKTIVLIPGPSFYRISLYIKNHALFTVIYRFHSLPLRNIFTSYVLFYL